jgi:hypothetical protein
MHGSGPTSFVMQIIRQIGLFVFLPLFMFFKFVLIVLFSSEFLMVVGGPKEIFEASFGYGDDFAWGFGHDAEGQAFS